MHTSSWLRRYFIIGRTVAGSPGRYPVMRPRRDTDSPRACIATKRGLSGCCKGRPPVYRLDSEYLTPHKFRGSRIRNSGLAIGRSSRENRYMNAQSQRRQAIVDETELTNDHLTPEFGLRLITPNCRLWTADPIGSTENGGSPFPEPYWAFYWPGGQALTRFILDNETLVRSKVVLDVGSGCGATSLACLKAGAQKVIANDIDTDALLSLDLNFEANRGLMNSDGALITVEERLEKTSENLIGICSKEWDVVLLGDMFYDEQFTKLVCDWLDVLHGAGKVIVIGDPGRLYLQSIHGSATRRRSLVQLAEYKMTWQNRSDNICHGFSSGYVWKWTGQS
ncbi:electron transfer flavoprotein beta subunit lysine methyltransferase-like [Tubulanus polymorphus]|uniref:electron transfer flavoprotein beta subunit lysine methyltransferase-like n=1 Tax=Tubulanus polymorphus TaxID=672921 RepID=UPI003DA3F40E